MSALAIVGAVGVGLLACAVLVVNNLRDIPGDAAVGKRTLAVALGDRDTRRLYAALRAGAARACPRWPGSAAGRCCSACSRCRWPSPLTRRVLGGADGRRLVRVLGDTGLLLLAWSVATAVGLALGPVA